MTAYGPPPVAPRSAVNPDQRARLLAMVAGGLGVLTFIWGFLNWFSENTGEKTSYGGYAIISSAPAAIGFSVAAGLLALAHVFEKKSLTVVPLALAVTSLLLLIGMLIGKGDVKAGSQSADVSVSVGMVLAFITVIVQVAALAVGWLDSTGRMKGSAAGAAPAWPGSGAYAAQPGQPAQPVQTGGQPAQYGAPTSYGAPQGEYRPQSYPPPAPQGYPGTAAPAEPTQSLPIPGEGRPMAQPGQYPPPPQGEYQPQHPQ